MAHDESKKRILFLNAGAELYGADRVLFDVVTGLDRDRFEPVVILNNPGDLAERFRACGIAAQFLRLGILRRRYFRAAGALNRSWRVSRAVASLVGRIRRERIDVVYSNTCNVVAGALAAWLTGRLHVLHLQEILVSPRIVWRFLARYFGAFSHQIIVTSNAVREHLKAEVPRTTGRTVVVPDGVDTSRFVPTGDRGAIRAGLGLTEDHCVVGMVGRINPRKGHDGLIESADRLAPRFPGLRWVVVGGSFAGEEHIREALIADVRRRGLADRVLFVDYRADIERVYPAFDLLVSPSPVPESFGLVLVEAMACEVPVVATRQGGPLDIVAEGETGLLVAPGDVTALAEAVSRLAADPDRRARMGKAGRERVLAHFTVERFQARINRVLAALVDTRRGVSRVPENGGDDGPSGRPQKGTTGPKTV